MTAEYDADFLLRLPASEYLTFISNRIEDEQREVLYRQWLTLYPYMMLKYIKFMTFQDYYDHVTGKNLDMRDAETIIEEIKALHHME